MELCFLKANDSPRLDCADLMQGGQPQSRLRGLLALAASLSSVAVAAASATRVPARGGAALVHDAAGHRLSAVALYDDPWECVTGADAVVIVTEWPEVVGLDWIRVAAVMRGDVLVDGRNALDPLQMVSAG